MRELNCSSGPDSFRTTDYKPGMQNCSFLCEEKYLEVFVKKIGTRTYAGIYNAQRVQHYSCF